MKEFVDAVRLRADHSAQEIRAAESRAYGEIKTLIHNFQNLNILTEAEADALITEMSVRFNIKLGNR